MRIYKIIIAVFILCAVSPISRAQITNQVAQKENAFQNKIIDQKQLTEDKFYGVIRGFVWGLPPTLILEEEKGTFIGEENGSLFYLDYIRGLKSTIAYEFDDDKLSRIKVFVEAPYADKQKRVRDLLLIQEDLDRRFGDPILEDFRWTDETDKNYPDSWGWAIDRGELFITMMWQNNETVVTAYIGKTGPGEIQFSVTYEQLSTKLEQLEEIKNKKNKLF